MAKGKRYPAPYESLGDFMYEVRLRFQEGVDADRPNTDAALDDLKFLSGEQWDETVKAGRLRAGKPCLTINRLPQFVGQVIGDTRINRPSIRVLPAEDGDKDIAEVRMGLVRAIERDSDAQGVYTIAGEDQVACGLGNFRVNLEYVDNDVFDQDIRIRALANPFAVIWDPMSVERTGADARYCFVIDEVPRRAFEKRYPGVQLTELGDAVAAQGWVTRDVVRVAEYWTIKETERKIALLDDGTIQDITGKEAEFEARIAKTEAGKPRVRKVMRKSACMYLVGANEILEDPYELPISRLPIIKVTGREVRVGDKRVRFGLVRFAKDAQRLLNYWRSVSAELLALAPRAQWLAKSSDMEGWTEGFRNAHRSGDPVLLWEGANEPKRLDPPAFPAAIVQEAALNAQDMKDVTGLHDASLGAQSNETSGKAIMARERQGDVATFMYHDNLQASIREAGRVVNDLIPVVYDTARTIRVIGEDETAKLQKINDPNDPEAIDLGKGKYDIVISTGPSYTTKRVEAAESMMTFVQAVPQVAAVAGDLIAEAQDWPNAEAIAERMKKALPPQLTAKEGEDMSDEEKAEAQKAQEAAAQQQQVQQQGQAMEMAKMGAETKKAEADARKADADALKAEAEALEAQLQLNANQSVQIIAEMFGPGAAQAFVNTFAASLQQQQQQTANDQQQGPPQAA